jgi:hypothetical protein
VWGGRGAALSVAGKGAQVLADLALWLLPDLVPPVSYPAVPLALAAVALPTGQHWTAGVATVAIVVGAGHSGLARRGRQDEPASDALSVVSWHTRYWDQTSPELYEFLKAKNADVYVLQERLHGSHYDPRPAPDLPRLREDFPTRGLSLWQLDWTFTRGVRVHRYGLGDPQGISDHRTQELLLSPGDAG